MSSSDDMVSQEARHQEAFEVAGLLREMELKSADPEKRADLLRGAVRGMLEPCLRSAIELLGEDHRVMPAINELIALTVAAEGISLDIVQENTAYVARALEDRFHLRSSGGYGGLGFSITRSPRSIVAGRVIYSDHIVP